MRLTVEPLPPLPIAVFGSCEPRFDSIDVLM